MRAWVLRCCLLLLACGAGMVHFQASAQQGCTAGACVSAGPRLVSVNSTQGPLLNLLFRTLLPGTSVNASVLDWNALAQTNVNLNALVTRLGLNLGLSDTSQVLGTQITLAQLQAALVQVAQADGSTATVSALGSLSGATGAASGTFQLGQLLQVSLPKGALSDVRLNVLDLLTGSVQLYNYRNVLTTPTPVTVDTAALGLTGLASLQLWLQVVEPPAYVCGSAGAQFHSGAIRAKLNAQAVNNFDLAAVLAALDALGVANASVSADALKVQAYADIARAEGSLGTVDGLNNAVSFTARPGLVNLYVGSIADAVFFNRSQVITSAVVGVQELTRLYVGFRVSLLGIGVVDVQVPLSVNAKAAATGSPALQSFTVSGPFPQTRTASSGTVSATNLISELVNNLVLSIGTGTIVAKVAGIQIATPQAVINLVNSLVVTVQGLLAAQVNTVVAPVLRVLLGDVVDNLLGLLGIRIGNAVFTVEGIARSCLAVLKLQKVLSPTGNGGRFDLSIRQGSTVVASASGVGHDGVTGEVVTTAETDYLLAETAASGTVLSSYASTWACSDQNGNALASGTGTSFTFTTPAIRNTQLLVTCRITNRVLSADLSISKSDSATSYTPGGTATYVITVRNAGPDAVTGAVVNDTLPTGATLSAPWTCTASGGGACGAAAGGAAGQASLSATVDLPLNGQVVISVPVKFSAGTGSY
ncbi:DUF11 domain-containing protein [Pseudoxanthomonas composti]|uniref:DUF11 domain-containing protein n=1 Tax=Pseudoxanthomonas composti TaxID=2137479 RepID=A0A4V1N0N2_9GAMM|nr:DUF11 domain-containing protein [Pseudoxanthomonas composti]RXQ99397.1 DUF11 domain-containing protein [Pseudoxanthomonas composti]